MKNDESFRCNENQPRPFSLRSLDTKKNSIPIFNRDSTQEYMYISNKDYNTHLDSSASNLLGRLRWL